MVTEEMAFALLIGTKRVHDLNYHYYNYYKKYYNNPDFVKQKCKKKIVNFNITLSYILIFIF